MNIKKEKNTLRGFAGFSVNIYEHHNLYDHKTSDWKKRSNLQFLDDKGGSSAQTVQPNLQRHSICFPGTSSRWRCWVTGVGVERYKREPSPYVLIISELTATRVSYGTEISCWQTTPLGFKTNTTKQKHIFLFFPSVKAVSLWVCTEEWGLDLSKADTSLSLLFFFLCFL